PRQCDARNREKRPITAPSRGGETVAAPRKMAVRWTRFQGRSCIAWASSHTTRIFARAMPRSIVRPMSRPADQPTLPPSEPAARPRSSAARLLPLLALVIVTATVFAMGWHRELSLENLVRHRAAIDAFIAAHGAAAVGAFVLLYIIVVALSIPGGATVLTI